MIREYIYFVDDNPNGTSGMTKEEIIRCKDCKYWQDNNNGYPVTDCRWNKDETPDADDFCSFAERKEQ